MNKHALGLAVGLAVMQPQAVHALSLGEVKVESVLSQPLRARIDLHDIAVNDLSDVNIQVASENLFRRMGMERSFTVNNLKFDTVLYGDQPALLIHTRYPFKDPFLHIVLEVSHQNQVILQEYTLMPDMPQAQSPVRTDAGRRYVVKRGDTLFKIASRFRYAGTNTNQMMLAILQRNPRAFVRGDGNRLKANVEMTIPARQVVNTVTRRDAQAFRGRLVKDNFSKKALAKQPVAQPERSVDALNELEKTRQHLTALQDQTRDVKTALQTSETDVQQHADASVSQPTINRLKTQLDVKDLKIAELQMRLARLNKTLLVEQATTTGSEPVASTPTVFDATTLEETSDFEPKLVIAPTSLAQHTIAMSGLPQAKAGAPSPGDADEGAVNAGTSRRQQTHKPIVITEVQQPSRQLQHAQLQQPVTAIMAVESEPVIARQSIQHSTVVVPDTPAAPTKAESRSTAEALSQPASIAIAPVQAVAAVSAPMTVSPASLLDNEADASNDLLAALTSPLALYLELGAFFLLAVVWLYARHQRRKWRLVDDVVRDLEAKRAEQGREKLLWDKLVYAPDDWLIELPELPESNIPAPQEQSQLPDVEQLEALLRHDKQPFKVPPETVTQEVAAVNAVSVGQLPQEQGDQNDQVEALRRQIDEMQQMLNNLQQHRADLERQRDAA